MAREVLMHFLNIGTGTDPEYVLLGDGITSLTEEFNPESEKKHYINKKSPSNNVKSYSPSISVEKEYIQDEALQDWIDKKVRELPTGAKAKADYVRINIMEAADDSGNYPAVKQPCSYQFDSIGGEAGGDLMNKMTLAGDGDSIQGTFNVATKTFTASVTG